MREFRTLRADEVECRVAQVNGQYGFVKCLLYKTARTDAALLDEKFGMFGWQNDYRIIDGKMYCGIGVRDKETGAWVWKWNVGTESNMEKEKGEASDAMKRAGFVLGIGTELYSAPDITLWANSGQCTIKDNKCRDSFAVSVIEYDEKENISKLIVVNRKTGAVAFSWEAGKHEPKTPPTAANGIYCDRCGRGIFDFKMKDGTVMTAEKFAENTQAVYGHKLCKDCAAAEKERITRNAGKA